jgi:parallel beta-helix repeat protein
MNSSRNTVSWNILDNNTHVGINGHASSNYNNITEIVITNGAYGMFYHAATYNNFCRNNISATDEGLWLQETVDHNTAAQNNFINNNVSVRLQGSANNTLRDNTLTNYIVGFNLTQYSANNRLFNNTITNGHVGVELASSSQNNISYNRLAENNCSIHLSQSNNNRIFDNEIAHNNMSGITLRYSSNNRFYHNNPLNNTIQVNILTGGYSNIWDDGCPSGGNYWSDYNGSDVNRDGLGDAAYVIDTQNVDRYPLVFPVGFFPWDMNEDGYVGVDDIFAAAFAFGSDPESERWNPKADLNRDNYVGIDDVQAIAQNFGRINPLTSQAYTHSVCGAKFCPATQKLIATLQLIKNFTILQAKS